LRQAIVGAVPAPSHVSARGIGPPSAKSGVANWIVSGALGSGLASSPQPARSASATSHLVCEPDTADDDDGSGWQAD
jgi:hypothetical protein